MVSEAAIQGDDCSVRHSVSTDPLHAEQIRPRVLLEQYLQLMADDIVRLLNPDAWSPRNCPACGASAKEAEYEKMNFQYQRCVECHSLYVSPCPSEAQLANFYQRAEALTYWREQFSVATAKARELDVLTPRADWIADIISGHLNGPVALLDLKHEHSHSVTQSVTSEIVATCHIVAALSGLPVPEFLQGSGRYWQSLFDYSAPATVQVATAFNVIERSFDPLKVIQACGNWLDSPGLIFVTAKSCAGFDIRMLGKQARHVGPPIDLNLLSRRGLKIMLERSGFELLEFSTPGRLDVEVVNRAKDEDPNLALPPILCELITSEDSEIRLALQRLLQQARLSSYVRIAALKG